MKNKANDGFVEIHFTDEQTNKIMETIEYLENKSQGQIPFLEKVKCNMKKIWNAFVSLIVNILTLKNTGKWISVITIAVVLIFFGKFLAVQQFSVEAMKIIVPYLGEIAVVVFGVIGGFKGAESLIKKLQESKTISSVAGQIFGTKEEEKESEDENEA